MRWTMVADAPEKMAALALLKVGEQGAFWSSVDARLSHLSLRHMACHEDVSVLQDGSLWKLSIDLPNGSHERPRVRTERHRRERHLGIGECPRVVRRGRGTRHADLERICRGVARR